MRYFWVSCLFLLTAPRFVAHADPSAPAKKRKTNRIYIQDYQKKYLVLRAFEATKFNNFGFTDGKTHLIYRPNDHNNIGIGGTYRFLSLNLGFHMPFADRDTDTYGTTKRLDLQTHIYNKKFIIDFFGQFYRGFYLGEPDIKNKIPGYDIKRPDIHSRDLSLSVQYVFNNSRFSYNAPLYQTEVQKKSAGSFIAGAGIYFTRVFADSSLVPRPIPDSSFFGSLPFSGAEHAGISLNAGYGYTVVIRKHFFISTIFTLGAGVGSSSLRTKGNKYVSPGAQFDANLKCAAGYNYKRWYAGLNYMGLATSAASALPGTSQQVNRGVFRLTVAHRIKLHRHIVVTATIAEDE